VQRVVVTGMGAITPIGADVASSWEAALAGQSGVTTLPDIAELGLPVRIGARVKDFDPTAHLDRKEARRFDRFVGLAASAADEAMADARLLEGTDPQRVGVAFGSGIGGMSVFCEQHQAFLEKGPDRVSPFFIPTMIPNMGSGYLAMRWDLQGPNVTTVTACASSASAIAEAMWTIKRGDADAMLAGGAEAVVIPLAYAGFCSMKALSTRNDDPEGASRPFDASRDGFVMGEGGGFVVLESLEHARGRGARIYAELLGAGQSADAFHMVEPRPDGRGAAQSMTRALAHAGVAPADIDYINAHATATPKGDRGEAEAILRVFGEAARDLSVSSTKSMTGHLLGAAGAVELIFSILALRDQVVPPTINLDEPEADLDLDFVPNVKRARRVDMALSNSFGFGGHNVSLVVGRPS